MGETISSDETRRGDTKLEFLQMKLEEKTQNLEDVTVRSKCLQTKLEEEKNDLIEISIETFLSRVRQLEKEKLQL